MIATYESDDVDLLLLARARHRADKRETLSPARRPSARSPLHIGYLSADFWSHPVAYNIGPAIAAHDRLRIRVSCYADVARPDAMTARLAASADRWVDLTGFDDRSIAEQIRKDGVDVLVILAGHTAHNHLGVSRYRAARIQVSLADVATSGAREIEGFIADPILCPVQLHSAYSERVLMVSCLYCVAIPEDAPQPRASVRPRLVLGSFSNPANIGASNA